MMSFPPAASSCPPPLKYVAAHLLAEVPHSTQAPAHLTDRERQVLHLVAEGLTNREIADAYEMTESGVRKMLERAEVAD